MRRAVLVAIILMTAVVLGCCGGAPEELQIRWANAACEPHGGIDQLDKGGEEDDASVICKDGSAWVQEYNGEDAENPYETPVEVRARQRGEPSE